MTETERIKILELEVELLKAKVALLEANACTPDIPYYPTTPTYPYWLERDCYPIVTSVVNT